MNATNCTDILNCTYDLHSIIGTDAILNPPKFFATVNFLEGSHIMITLLVVFGIALFFIARRFNTEATDVENFAYAGFITSIIGGLLFVVQTGLVVGGVDIKLIDWVQLFPIIALTGAAFFVKFMNKRY